MAAVIAVLLSATIQPAAANHIGGGFGGGHGGMGPGHGGMGPGHGGMGPGHGGMGPGHGGMGPGHGGMGPGHGGMGPGHGGMGPGHGGMGTAPHFPSGRGSGHAFGHFDHRHDFAFRHHEFDHFRDDRFFHHHHHNSFIFVFDFVAFGFPSYYPYYPYYGYPYDYSYSDYGAAYDYQYWNNLAVSVQSELARRGYYHGAIDGAIGSGSRQAIRAFQAAQGLPVTGRIDPKLLKALGIKYKTA
jgi:Putative peptidoglycan binding domain